MKRIWFVFLSVLSFFFSAACVSFEQLSLNKTVDIPFEGTMDCRFGYEDLYFGMTTEDIKKVKKYPVVQMPYEKNHCFIGHEDYVTYSGKYSYSHYGHGDVNSTDFYFFADSLYKIEEVLSVKNPDLEYLHNRYGDFSDENLLSSTKDPEKLPALFTNTEVFNAEGKHSLEIYIGKNGLTTVHITDPFIREAMKDEEKLAFIKDRRSLSANRWYVFKSIDGENKRYNYTFINTSEDKKRILVQYAKDPVGDIRSSVAAGFGDSENTIGDYEIKTRDGLIKKNFSSAKISLAPYDWYFYSYSWNPGESARWMINLILSNENVQIRKSGNVTAFNLSGFGQLLDSLGITWDELDYAIANEEF